MSMAWDREPVLPTGLSSQVPLTVYFMGHFRDFPGEILAICADIRA